MLTRKRIWITLAAVATAALGTFAATGVGGEAGYDAPGTGINLKADPVQAPRGAAAKAVARASAVKIFYRETQVEPIPEGTQLLTVGKCPRRSGVVNGYYGRQDDDGFDGVANQGGAPTPNLRKWQFAINQDSGEDPTDMFFGIICVKP